MKRKLNLLLVLMLILSFSIHGYAVNGEATHIYYKYTVKTWWNKNNNNGLFEKNPIYTNQLEKVPYYGGTSISYSDSNRISGYRSYEFVPISVNGYTSYELRGVSLFNATVGDVFLSVGRHAYDSDDNLTYAYSKQKFIKVEPYLDTKWARTTEAIERYRLKLDYYIYEHKDKDIFLSEIIAPRGTYPSNGLHTDGYWYVDMGVLNKTPSINIIQPITNQRIGNQDSLIINGTVKDEDVGDILSIKYSINNIGSSNVTLTQPTFITSNGQTQSFQGYIKLNNLSSGDNNLKVWAEDNKGAKSNIVEVPIIAFNTLENVMKSLKSYTYKSGEPQYLVVNSSNTITQSIDNDNLISQIKRELEAKNIKLFFIGKDGTTESYINTKLLSN